MRMALVEAMYKEEKPFLIFDDPFVNLDDNNIKGAMSFSTRLQRIIRLYILLAVKQNTQLV